MAASTTPALQPIIPGYHLRILTDAQLTAMRSATLDILGETGIHCPSEKARRIFAEHGAHVDPRSGIVKIPAGLVLEHMQHAPRTYTLGARRPEFDLLLDGHATYLATDGCGVETIDFVTRQRRASCKDDVARMARVADYLSSISFYWPIVSAQDHPATAPLHELEASFANTVKHVQSETIMEPRMAELAVEMARIIAGSSQELRARPPLSLLVCCISPLGLDGGGMEAALTLAAAGLPVGFMSMANVAATAPATLAGTLVMGDAEIVAALTLIQMACPGAPVFHSMMPGIMHPHTGAYLATAWEGTLLYPAGVELAHAWGVPSLAGVFATDGQVPGWQSGGDAASSLLLCALAGAETGAGLGLLESCTLLYPEALILDSDIYHRVRIEAAGLDTSPAAMAVDVIKEVGPRGAFLKHRHTREHLRRRTFSDLSAQPGKDGRYRDPLDVARDRVTWILENHQPEPLDPYCQREIGRIVQLADETLD